MPPRRGVACVRQRDVSGAARKRRASGLRRSSVSAHVAIGSAARAARELTGQKSKAPMLGGFCGRLHYFPLQMTVYADLYRFRELFANLFRRDFHSKYKGSLLGVLWSLLNPLLLLGVYLVVFGLLFPNTNTPHYPIYLLSGLARWLF